MGTELLLSVQLVRYPGDRKFHYETDVGGDVAGHYSDQIVGHLRERASDIISDGILRGSNWRPGLLGLQLGFGPEQMQLPTVLCIAVPELLQLELALPAADEQRTTSVQQLLALHLLQESAASDFEVAVSLVTPPQSPVGPNFAQLLQESTTVPLKRSDRYVGKEITRFSFTYQAGSLRLGDIFHFGFGDALTLKLKLLPLTRPPRPPLE